jgi:glycosyltransferase involved in cell wall biosynthesis
MKKNKTIYFIAPFDPDGFKLTRFLAAHKKIQFILNLLSETKHDVFLICSTPNTKFKKPTRIVSTKLSNNITIKALIPSSSIDGKLNMVGNIIKIPKIINYAINNFGKPDVVYTYNAYAFEMKAAKYLSDKCGSFVVLEFDDWHFARGINAKAIVDWFYWQRALSSINYSFSVNQFIEDVNEKYGIESSLLPGTVNKEIVKLSTSKPPFKSEKNYITCGYFGGLTKDKGADFLIKMIEKSTAQKLNIRWFITGKGPFEEELKLLSKNYSDMVTYFGVVSDIELAEIIGRTDVLLNPHIKMDGVFPFKLIEYVASGRLVLSSEMTFPIKLNWIKDSILFENLELDKWLETILKSLNSYNSKRKIINSVSKKVSIEFSKRSIRDEIEKVIK